MAGRSGWWEKMIRRGGIDVTFFLGGGRGGRLLFLNKLSYTIYVFSFVFACGSNKNKHGITSFFAWIFVAVLDLSWVWAANNIFRACLFDVFHLDYLRGEVGVNCGTMVALSIYYDYLILT